MNEKCTTQQRRPADACEKCCMGTGELAAWSDDKFRVAKDSGFSVQLTSQMRRNEQRLKVRAVS